MSAMPLSHEFASADEGGGTVPHHLLRIAEKHNVYETERMRTLRAQLTHIAIADSEKMADLRVEYLEELNRPEFDARRYDTPEKFFIARGHTALRALLFYTAHLYSESWQEHGWLIGDLKIAQDDQESLALAYTSRSEIETVLKQHYATHLPANSQLYSID